MTLFHVAATLGAIDLEEEIAKYATPPDFKVAMEQVRALGALLGRGSGKAGTGSPSE